MVVYEPTHPLLTIRGEMTVFELLSVVGFLVALVSLILAVRSSMEQGRTRTAEFSFKVWERFREDDVQRGFLTIEWGRFRYPYATQNGFESDEQEREIDRLLLLLDDVAGLARSKILSPIDVGRWEYIGHRVFQDDGVRAYLAFLEDHYARNGIQRGPHMEAKSYFSSE